MKISEILAEAHYNLPSREMPDAPLKNEDTITLYHGFRSLNDAILITTKGASGAEFASRVYSYESDNNPKGLFVTPDLKTAQEFGDTVIEFTCKMTDLEPPVWPSGSFTVQGGISSYWGHGREGVAKRRQAQQRLRGEIRSSDKEIVSQSDDPLLADTLLNMGERQALFVGHLNPSQITAVYSYTTTYTPIKQSREEFLETHKNFELDKSESNRVVKYRVFAPDEKFDGDELLKRMKYPDIEDSFGSLWRNEILSKPTNKGQHFKRTFNQWLWPAQMPDAFIWFRKKYGSKIA
jgi:hypothetical protein